MNNADEHEDADAHEYA